MRLSTSSIASDSDGILLEGLEVLGGLEVWDVFSDEEVSGLSVFMRDSFGKSGLLISASWEFEC